MTRRRSDVVTKTASFTVTNADNDVLFLIGTADIVATLPAVTAENKGMRVSFAMLTAGLSSSTGFSVSPASVDGIRGKVTQGTGAALSGTDNKDIVNTGSGDIAGDGVTLVSDGVDGWQVTSMLGTWASES